MIQAFIRDTRRGQGPSFAAVAAALALSFGIAVFGEAARAAGATGDAVSSLDGRRFEFTRGFPFQTFSDVRIALKLPGDWSGAPQPYVGDPTLHGVNSASGATAKIESFVGSPTGAELVIRIEGLAAAGDYDLPVQLDGAASPAQKITLFIRASDGPIVPFVVVCLGVVAGMASQHFARQRPTQLLRADVAGACGRVLRLQPLARADQAELAELLRVLAEIELKAKYNDPAPLRAQLDEVETRLGAIEQRRGEQRRTLQTAIRTLADRFDDQSGRWIDLDDAEKAASAEIDAGFGALRKAVEEDRLDDAQDGLRGVKRDFGAWVAGRATRMLAAIDAAAAKAPEAQRAKIQAAADSVRALLNLGPLDLIDKLPDLNGRIAALEREASLSNVNLPLAEKPAGKRHATAESAAPVDPVTAAETRQKGALEHMAASIFWLTLLSAVVAVATGWPTIYLGKAFGGFSDYVTAFVWGFGLNAATRNAADMAQK